MCTIHKLVRGKTDGVSLSGAISPNKFGKSIDLIFVMNLHSFH
jgi:hypothetical protein